MDAPGRSPSPDSIEWAKAMIAATMKDEVCLELVEVANNPADERAPMAAWALGHAKVPDHLRSRVVRVLIEVSVDPTRPDVLREHALEAIVALVQCAERTDPDRLAAEAVIVAMAGDPSPAVRFWSAFGLGQLQPEAALPLLRKLTLERTPVSGWWSVGEEASDAIDLIEGRVPPERGQDRGRVGPIPDTRP